MLVSKRVTMTGIEPRAAAPGSASAGGAGSPRAPWRTRGARRPHPLGEESIMRCRQLLIPAAVLAMVLASPWGHPRALGGTYTWAHIVGYGYYITYPENQF